MEIASMHRAVHPRSGADDQSETSRMVQLLRAFHAFCVPAHRASCRPTLVRWACRKYKKLRHHRTRAWEWLLRVIQRQPTLLALWEHQRGEVFTIGAV